MIFNSNKDIREIEGIAVTEKIKYLGVSIDNDKDLFKLHRAEVLKKANIFSNMMYLVTGKCVNRMLMGKAYWKNLILPSLLYGTGVMTFNAREIKKLQVIENAAYRRILEARSNTPICALRGEIGSSLMKTRFMETKVLLTKSIIDGSNKLTKQILEETKRQKGSKYNRTMNDYLRNLNIKYEDLNELSKENIRKITRKWDDNKWKDEISKKSSLKIYRKFKKEVQEEKGYDNRKSSTYLLQARTNTLPLNTERRHKGGDTKCELCNEENEDLIHFLIDCPGLEQKRNKEIMMTYKSQDKEIMAGNILFTKEKKEEVKIMIEEMWNLRLSMKIQRTQDDKEKGKGKENDFQDKRTS